MRKYILILTLILGLTGCQFKGSYYDFDNVEEAPELFRVTKRQEVELNDDFKTQMRIRLERALEEDNEEAHGFGDAEGVASRLGETEGRAEGIVSGKKKTSSVPMTSIVQNLLEWSGQNNLIQLSGVYQSIDVDWSPITLSGKVILPKKGKIKNIIIVSHYTIGSNDEAPSNTFPVEGLIASKGYAMIFPDYIGYGVTCDRIHPYLAMDLTAQNVMDMYRAVKPFLKASGVKVESDSLILMGYSQGGATTMALQHLIETEVFDEPRERDVIKRVFVGGGPYDIVSTYDKFVISDWASYPCAVPLVIQGMIEGSGLKVPLDSFVTPLVADHIDEWFNSKKYRTSEMNEMLGTYITSDLVSERGRDRNSAAVANLYKAMYVNSIVNVQDGWFPEAPVYMLHSIDDNTVDYINAQKAKDAWPYANIEYNFGHYGTHVTTALRFVMTVRTML